MVGRTDVCVRRRNVYHIYVLDDSMLRLDPAAQERWLWGLEIVQNVYLEDILEKSHSKSFHCLRTTGLDMLACESIILSSAVFRMASDIACLEPGEEHVI